MTFDIWNRRYTGSKYKLSGWIVDLIHTNCSGKSFCDIFAGTAIMSKQMLNSVEEIYINDFLYSNELIYRAFFEQKGFSTRTKKHHFVLDDRFAKIIGEPFRT